MYNYTLYRSNDESESHTQVQKPNLQPNYSSKRGFNICWSADIIKIPVKMDPAQKFLGIMYVKWSLQYLTLHWNIKLS